MVRNKIQGHYPAYCPQFHPVASRSTSSQSFSTASPCDTASSCSSTTRLCSNSSSSAEPCLPNTSSRECTDSHLGRRNHCQGGQTHKSLSSSGAAAPELHVDISQVPVNGGNSQDTTPDSGCVSSKPDDDVKFSIGEFDHDGKKNAVQVSSENSATRHDLPLEKKVPLTIADIVSNFISANSRAGSMPSLSSEIGVNEDAAMQATPGSHGTSVGNSSHQDVINSDTVQTSRSRTTDAEQVRNEEVAQSRSRRRGRKRQN